MLARSLSTSFFPFSRCCAAAAFSAALFASAAAQAQEAASAPLLSEQAPTPRASRPAPPRASETASTGISAFPDLSRDCGVISRAVNDAAHEKMATCRVEGQRVVLAPSSASNAPDESFFAVTALAAGVAVNKGLYAPQTEFVMGPGRDGAGCRSLYGAQASNFQTAFDAAGEDPEAGDENALRVAREAGAAGKPVECPVSLRVRL